MDFAYVCVNIDPSAREACFGGHAVANFLCREFQIRYGSGDKGSLLGLQSEEQAWEPCIVPPAICSGRIHFDEHIQGDEPAQCLSASQFCAICGQAGEVTTDFLVAARDQRF